MLSTRLLSTRMVRFGLTTAAFLMLLAAPPAFGQLRVNLGIYGGQAHDIATYDDGGTTEMLISVRSQKAVYRRTATGWDAVLTEKNEGQRLEADISTGNAGVVWATADSQLYTHGPTDPWDNTGWTLHSTIIAPTVLTGHSSGMFVGTDSEVFRSSDGGATFSSLITFSSMRVLSISVYSSTLFFAVVGEPGNSMLYKCEDAGSGFVATAITVTDGSATVTDFEVVGIDPLDAMNSSAAMRFYAAGNSAQGNAYKTEDGGVTWSKLPLGTDDGYPQYIAFTTYGGGQRVFISSSYSDDFGATWTGMPNLSTPIGTRSVVTHANDGAIAFDPNDANIVYMDTDWAVGQWDMSGTSAFEINEANGIESVLLAGMDQIQTDATTKATLWIATKSGLAKTTNYPATSSATDWVFPIFPQDDGAPPTTVAIHPTDLDTGLAGNNGSSVYMTTNGGENPTDWTDVLNLRTATYSSHYTTPERAGFSDVEILLSDPNIVYAGARMTEGAYEGGVDWSQDGGLTWEYDFTDTSGADFNMPVNALMVIDNAVWAGVGHEADTTSGARGLYARLSVVLDGNWWAFPTGVNLDSEVVRSLDGTKVGSVFTVYVATTGGVYVGTLDSAVTSTWTWSDITPNGSQSYVAVAVNPNDADEVYVAHDNSIFASFDGGATWGLLPPSGTTAHEDVFALLYDDLIMGTANGLYAPTEEAIATIEFAEDGTDTTTSDNANDNADDSTNDNADGANDNTSDDADNANGNTGDDGSGGANDNASNGDGASGGGVPGLCGVGGMIGFGMCFIGLSLMARRRRR